MQYRAMQSHFDGFESLGFFFSLFSFTWFVLLLFFLFSFLFFFFPHQRSLAEGEFDLMKQEFTVSYPRTGESPKDETTTSCYAPLEEGYSFEIGARRGSMHLTPVKQLKHLLHCSLVFPN